MNPAVSDLPLSSSYPLNPAWGASHRLVALKTYRIHTCAASATPDPQIDRWNTIRQRPEQGNRLSKGGTSRWTNTTTQPSNKTTVSLTSRLSIYTRKIFSSFSNFFSFPGGNNAPQFAFPNLPLFLVCPQEKSISIIRKTPPHSLTNLPSSAHAVSALSSSNWDSGNLSLSCPGTNPLNSGTSWCGLRGRNCQAKSARSMRMS